MTNLRNALRRTTTSVVVISSFALAACASHQSSPASPKSSARALVGRELQDTAYASVYDLVAARRPTWLMSRGSDRGAQANEVRVLFDNQPMVSVNDLRTINPLLTYSVTYVDPAARNRGPVDGWRSSSGLIVVRSLNLVKRTGK